ncbi:MAG: hypothetical protein ACYDG3_00770 [Bacillati bacterium]
MNDDPIERALAQARALQARFAEAAKHGQEQLAPLLDDSLKQAQALRATLAEHFSKGTDETTTQLQTTLDALDKHLASSKRDLAAAAERIKPQMTAIFEQMQRATDEVVATLVKRTGGK